MNAAEITDLLAELPGAELILPGLADFSSGRHTLASLLVSIASNRLRRYGLLVCKNTDIYPDAEIALYELLSNQPGDAYFQYNAYLARLDSFENALDHRMRRARNAPAA
jgi:hypothetical protein